MDWGEGSERCKKGEKTGENEPRKVDFWVELAGFRVGLLVGEGEALEGVGGVAATSLRLGDARVIDPG